MNYPKYKYNKLIGRVFIENMTQERLLMEWADEPIQGGNGNDIVNPYFCSTTYPKYKYHKTIGACVVTSKEEDEVLVGWQDSPIGCDNRNEISFHEAKTKIAPLEVIGKAEEEKEITKEEFNEIKNKKVVK